MPEPATPGRVLTAQVLGAVLGGLAIAYVISRAALAAAEPPAPSIPAVRPHVVPAPLATPPGRPAAQPAWTEPQS